MSSQHCCGANQLFDEKTAVKDLKSYLKKGPNKETKLLTEALKKQQIIGYSLLDIGGGIGPIPLEIIPNGVSKVTDVDASSGYIKIAKQEALKRNYAQFTEYVLGDFVTEANEIQTHDIVTLDKVLCCYPNVNDLLKTSLSKATKYYGVVYPQSCILSRFIAQFLNLKHKIMGNPFRTFIHNPEMIEQTILNAGFKKIYNGKTLLLWQVQLYEKC